MRDRSGSRSGRRLVVAAVVLTTLLGSTGCGDDAEPVEEDPDPTTTAPSGDDSDAEPSDGAEADETDDASAATITIVGFDFGEPLTVATGATVTVTNDDGVAHTWTANDGTFDSGSIDSGGSYDLSFDEPGDFDFFCEIHQSMTGSITVTA